MTTVLDRFAEAQLTTLADEGLLRVPDDGDRRRAAGAAAERLGLPLVDASSNDYLGLSAADVSRETGVQVGAPGAGASRLIHGSRPSLIRLEAALAAWLNAPTSLLFTSGYAANVGLASVLGVRGSVVFSDRLNHASIIDGCRLGRARIEVVPHLDLGALESALSVNSSASLRWVVTESCFSMDGDGPDLRALRALCDLHSAGLIVDEAHALGVFGPRGAGRCAELGVVPDALVGTLGKAIGTQGAFIAGSSALRRLLWNKARSFVFSTATSPLLAEVTLLHVEQTQNADDRRTRLLQRARNVRALLTERGLTVSPGLGGPIVPVMLRAGTDPLGVVAFLESQGILAQAIRPPTVPVGGTRIRLTVSAAWPDGAELRVAEALSRAMERPS